MSSIPANTLRKEERLCGKTSVSSLISTGKWGSTAHLKYCWVPGSPDKPSRILVSVPKKHFKRAVKRNLLKRRIREAYRIQKAILADRTVDIMFQYNSKQLADWQPIREEVTSILNRLSK